MDNVISLITLYNPTGTNINNARRIAEQSTFALLIDNSSASNEELLKNVGIDNRVIYCPNYDNLGLSIAFNKVLKSTDVCQWRDEDFLIFFDQDSVIDDGHINRLVEEYKRLEEYGITIGCIGPAYYDLSQNAVRTPKVYKKINEQSIIVDSIMTSSMVCRYGNIRKSGFWSEDIFLDMADWDMCWKMKKIGLVSVMTDVALLTHKVGEGSKRVGPITLDIAKPFREYYETRDCVYMLKKDYVPFRDRIRFHMQLTLRPLMHLRYLDDKAEREYYIKLGFRHAKTGVTGKLPQKDIWNPQTCS